MTTMLDRAAITQSASPAQRLRTTTAATRVSFTWLGVQKSLTPEQRAIAAESFGAERDFLSAGKKLLDVKHPAFKAVTAVKGKITAYWRSRTLPFPEPGIRLIRQDRIAEFDRMMNEYQDELAEAVTNLDRHYAELRAAAADRLGTLYDAADYPQSLRGWFGVEWSFPSVEPPDYLLELNPQLYAAEQARIAARFEEAVQLAEQAFASEFAKLVGHLCERISGCDGQPKIFRDSAVGNLVEFFDRFRSLSVRSNLELEELVGRVQQLVRGVAPQDLRDGTGLRQEIAGQLTQVQNALDELLVDRPRRRVLRNSLPRETI